MYDYSVIIPHYKDMESLKALLGSIPLRQDIQVIVVDDHSFEDPEEFIRTAAGFRGGNTLYLTNPDEKNGAGRCRNEALKHAEGKWLVFADADDMFTEDAFDKMDAYASSGADIVYFVPTSVRLPENETGKRHIPSANKVKAYLEKKDELSEAYLRYDMFAPWTKMIRHSMVEEHGIRFNGRLCANDVMFSVRCGYYADSIEACEDVIYCITDKAGTLTLRNDPSSYKDRFKAYVERYIFLRGRVKKEIFERLTGWMPGKIIRAAVQGYGYPMVRYMLKTYKKYDISLGGMSPEYIRNSIRFVFNSFRV